MIHASIQSAMASGYIRGVACAVFLAVLAVTIGWLIERWHDRKRSPHHPTTVALAVVGALVCIVLILRTTLTSFGVWA